MRNDLSPIAKHLILMFSRCTTYMTAEQVRAQLPDADKSALFDELLMLSRSEVVCRGIATSTQELVYWFADNGKPAGVDYWIHARRPASRVMTDADVGGIPPRTGSTLPTAPGLLDKAVGHMRARAAQYDQPEGERSMGATVIAFNAVTGRDLAESEGWLLLQLLKDVRLFQAPGYHADSAEDCIAYAALKGEAKAREAEAAHE
ncbi:hypothetical protein QYH69_29510 [Paraburkholderia sp. SARCC-3016]|uniref:hypothetical protein n=1 Tax=Paraburkholderia sp. SARCC-3016 TaxID=3058611 RepID=UPI002807D86A|nr:hypothetical protein [Paraburkholderia sp. SARCC-3016]MDQ7981374.1 hypothetical protein [Paraburkholderia sp. SARCC-3016]